MLQEPPKQQMLAYERGHGSKPQRHALVWVLNPPKGDLYEGVVLLPETGGKDAMVSWKHVSVWLCIA